MELSWHPCQKSIYHKSKDVFLESEFYSIDLYVYLYASTTCLSYFNFIVSFKIGQCKSSNFFLFFQIVLAIRGSPEFLYKF